jgi:hypothetical protein
MKRVSIVMAGCALLGAFALTAAPAGAYNSPKSAKGYHVELVTAFNQCTAPTLTHRPSLALPSCTPTPSSANNPANVLSFNLAGAMAVDFKTTTGNFKVTVHGRGIFNNDQPYTGNLVATTVLRVTDNGCEPAPYDTDCTRTDFPFPVSLICTNSICNPAAPNANSLLPGTVDAGDKANIEIGQLTLNDPDGDAFARGGLVVR